jgi:Zn-dependent protease with chaperone function
MVEEQVFTDQLEKMNASAVPVFQEAAQAMDSGDYQKAHSLLEEVIKLAPQFSTAYRRLAWTESAQDQDLGHREELLRKAIALESNAYNRSSLAITLIQKGTPTDDQEAFTLASQAVQEMPDDENANVALLMASVMVNNIVIARQTDEHLVEIAPWNPLGHYFAGLLAADDKHWEKAKSELLYSQRLGMDAGAVQDALNNGISRNVNIIHFLIWSGVALAAWLAVLGLIYLAGSVLSKMTLRSISKMEPTIGAQLQPMERTIRSIYRGVIVVLSFYFYISIPFVILSLIFVVGGAFYLFFAIGRIPIQLAIILVLMFFVSIFAILRSIFSRRKEVLVGRPISRSDSPALWSLVENVARKMETRPVDAVYLTPYAEIFVNEKGKKRNLHLGMGVLCSLNQAQLASIIAHEYGHFYNRDTAGGDLAFKVYAKLDTLAVSLVRSRAHYAYNPVWLFVMAYQRVFLRVSLGASRLQEILADRFAAMAYGRENFVNGLKNIVKQTLSFQLQANYEINQMLQSHQPINNLYQIPMQSELQGELEGRFEAALKRQTSAYDSHPSTMDRISLLERMRLPYVLDQESSAPVSDLFINFDELQQDLTARLIENIQIKR